MGVVATMRYLKNPQDMKRCFSKGIGQLDSSRVAVWIARMSRERATRTVRSSVCVASTIGFPRILISWVSILYFLLNSERDTDSIDRFVFASPDIK